VAEHEYFSLAAKNVAIARATQQLDAEIEQLRAFNAAQPK
jgi:hypothetical protein